MDKCIKGTRKLLQIIIDLTFLFQKFNKQNNYIFNEDKKYLIWLSICIFKTIARLNVLLKNERIITNIIFIENYLKEIDKLFKILPKYEKLELEIKKLKEKIKKSKKNF